MLFDRTHGNITRMAFYLVPADSSPMGGIGVLTDIYALLVAAKLNDTPATNLEMYIRRMNAYGIR